MFLKQFLVKIQEIVPVRLTVKAIWKEKSVKIKEICEPEIFGHPVKLQTTIK